ncbi:hypothetical protein EV401DRAFT_1938748 [Pisolithus croceorrhizus]|nr:hypothetical protein EV401DRAFT_1938748 [Pisolithus croceorrhizus]
MDDLTQARAALVALEKREQELLDELSSIRGAALLQRSRLEELIARMPVAPVNRLPTESLLRIFEFYLEAVPDTCDTYCHSKRDLASVSRRWRDVILHSPSLWTMIMVTPRWNEARAETYVTRSSQSLLDIYFMYGIDPDSDRISTAVFNTLASCAHRWRSLTLTNFYGPLQRLNHLSFPSLKQLTIADFPGSLTEQWELYLHPERSPRLEHVHLHAETGTVRNFHIPFGISALSLEFFGNELMRQQSNLSFLSGWGLTSLNVSGMSIDCDLPPNSIQLPLLKKFVCTVGNAETLIRALVAPSLKHFQYSPSYPRHSPSATFSNLNSKFDNVDYLCLSQFTAENFSEAVYLAFPNVCHLALVQTSSLPEPHSRTAEFPSAVFHWKNLKRLTIEKLEDFDLEFLNGLITWLQQRVVAGQSKLQVEFSSFGRGSLPLLQRLSEVCHLERSDVRHRVDMLVCRSGSQTWVEVHPRCDIDALNNAFATFRRTTVTNFCECGLDK